MKYTVYALIPALGVLVFFWLNAPIVLSVLLTLYLVAHFYLLFRREKDSNYHKTTVESLNLKLAPSLTEEITKTAEKLNITSEDVVNRALTLFFLAIEADSFIMEKVGKPSQKVKVK
jgi:hypothetical protein